MRFWKFLQALVVTAAAGFSSAASALDYPTRPISLIVPFPAGGPVDTLARLLAEPMRVSLGQPLVIENVGGASGSIAVARAARAAPDGYTMILGNWTSYVGTPAVYPVQFDVLKDFDAAGAALVTGGMLVLVYSLVRAPDVGWNNVRTIAGLSVGAVLIMAFVVNELRHPNPIAPLSIFKISGLGAANATQLTAIAGFYAMFFFVTLYMQEVLGFSPLRTGVAYLPVTVGVIALTSTPWVASSLPSAFVSAITPALTAE